MGKCLGKIMMDSICHARNLGPWSQLKIKQGNESRHCILEGYPCGGWRIEKGVGRPVWRLLSRSKVMRPKPDW